MIVRPASIWTESVFHVLAHVDAGAMAASCHDRRYVAWAETQMGPAHARSLAEDARALARAVTSHDLLARAQALAWVFDSAEEAARVEDRDLATLGDDDVAHAGALAIARSAGALAEVLRAAAELELPRLAATPVAIDPEAVEAALDVVSRAAPSLATHHVTLARALGLRGRALDRSIVVGVPGISCPDAEHAAWQAAHEATVGEVSARWASFEEIERKAIGLLRSRARAAGLGDAHGRWLARLDLRALGSIPDVDDPAE